MAQPVVYRPLREVSAGNASHAGNADAAFAETCRTHGGPGQSGHYHHVGASERVSLKIAEPRSMERSRSRAVAGADNAGVHELHNPFSPNYIPPEMWCINYADLEYFESDVRSYHEAGKIPDNLRHPFKHHDNPRIGPNIHQVNKFYIRPVTLEAGGMSWALMRHPRGLGPCQIFATHAWAEGVYEFCAKLRRVWPYDAKFLYCCHLGNPQNGNLESILSEGALTDSPFAQALLQAKYQVVLPNSTLSIYKRLWCVYEAHLAVRAAKNGDIKIELPWTASRSKILNQIIPGIVFPIFGWHVGEDFLSSFLSPALGPGMWLLFGFTVFSSGSYLIRTTLYKYWDVEDAAMWMVTWCYFQLFGLGLCADLSMWHFDHRGNEASDEQKWALAHQHHIKELLSFKHMDIRWELGEDKSCLLLGGCVWLAYIVAIIRELIHSVLDKEAHELDFKTVQDASCFKEADQKRITEEIEGQIAEIDCAIENLKKVGRYDKDVQRNLDLGLSHERIAAGQRPFKIVAAVCAWEFWWITDLDGRNVEYGANILFIVSCIIGLVAAYYIGSIAIFAIDSALFFGLGFAILSNHTIFFTRAAVLELRMSYSTLWLQLLVLGVMICTNYIFYSGTYRKWRDRILWSAREFEEVSEGSDSGTEPSCQTDRA